MKKSRFMEARIVVALKMVDTGKPVAEICRQHGISNATYYKWKSKYGGMEASDRRRVKELEAEYAQLKCMFADMALARSIDERPVGASGSTACGCG